MRRKKTDELTVSKPISTTRKDGSVVAGTMWMHASRRGGFEVEYDGRRASDGRTDYTSEGHMTSIARAILAEMAGKE